LPPKPPPTVLPSAPASWPARPADADEILDLDELIETSLYRVKNRLIDKTNKKKAPSLYPKLGIVKYKGDYMLDRERTKRAAALNTLVAGLTTQGIADGEWGTSFWQPIATRYNALVLLLTATDGQVSQAVAVKDTQRDFIEQVLSSIAQVISANFPDEAEYKAELRAAGFQREKYK
jgi:hypothetical protein